MTELLSKEHCILERPLMEFRPFGVDDRGEKICDVSGVVVQSNVEYLQDYLARTAGPHSRSDLSCHAGFPCQTFEQLFLRVRLLPA